MKWAPYCLPQGGPPWGNLYLTFHIIFVFILSSIINHHSSLINHQSSIISHQSSVINHQSSMINDQSSVINYQSWVCLWKKKRTSATKWVGNRIHEVSIGGTGAEIGGLSLLQWFRGSSRGVDGVYGEKTWPFWWSWGSSGNLEKSKLPGEVLEPKLRIYEPHRGRNRC